MEEQFEKIFARAKQVSLTSDEKSAGRTMLQSFMAMRPIRIRKSVRFFGKHAAVAATTLSLLLSAAGASYAAEGTVPGDALYAVKVNVNEEVRAALLASAKDKADWEAERAERRLSEVEALAARGKLKAAASAEIAVRFRAHAEKAQKQLAVLRTETNTDDADEVSTHLEVSLRAHGKILRELHDEVLPSGKAKNAQTQKRSDDDKKSLADIAAAVDTETNAVIDDRRRTEDTASKERDHLRAQKNASMRRAAAERKIAEARAFLMGKRVRLEGDVITRVETQLGKADASVREGDAKVVTNDIGAAVILYLEAQRTAQEAKFLIQTEHRLNIKIELEEKKKEKKEEREARLQRAPSHEERAKVKVHLDKDVQVRTPLLPFVR